MGRRATSMCSRSAGRISWSANNYEQDLELWYPEGECQVHYYARGQSKRGPSLKIPLNALDGSDCDKLFRQYSGKTSPNSQSSWTTETSVRSSISSYPSHPDFEMSENYDLHIPAPENLSREDAFKYHLTTRNFFAWALGKPLVGDGLGPSLIALLDRMNEYRTSQEDNIEDVIQYIDNQDYSDFRECPDHALAVLQFAEHFSIRDLWTDAFVHCTGMNNDLSGSGEFRDISRASKALITRAHLEMDIRIEHAGRSIKSFLEDDFSQALTDPGASSHMERFRSFLYTFYVAKYGYWPPMKAKKTKSPFPKALYTSMYFEFRKLYEYLVDSNTTKSDPGNVSVGGPNVFQILKTFDKKSKYTALPAYSPLTPEIPHHLCQKPQGFSKLFESKQSKADRKTARFSALTAATNPADLSASDCALVREYLRFEKTCALDEEDKLSCADARKVRWILIYGMLQTLISVTRAPVEVRDTEGVSYPLCCQIAGTPPWQVSKPQLPISKKLSIKTSKSQPTTPIEPTMDMAFNGDLISSMFESPKATVSFAPISNASTPQDSTPKVKTPSRPLTKRTGSTEDYFSLKPKSKPITTIPTPPATAVRTEPTQDYFSPRPIPTSAKPFSQEPSDPIPIPSRLSFSSVSVPLQSPQPRKPSFSEAFLALQHSNAAMLNLAHRQHTPTTSTSTFSSSFSIFEDDPSTPSTGASTKSVIDNDAWSAPAGSEAGDDDVDAMDHHSVGGECDDRASYYGDEEDDGGGVETEGLDAGLEMLGQQVGPSVTQLRLEEKGKGKEMMRQDKGVGAGAGMVRNGSVTSVFSVGRYNPEVERFLASS